MKYQLEILGDEIENPKGSIVFVHGICHGAWCWENFISYFSDAGYRCYALSLRGHGKSEGRKDLNKFTLADYVEDVKDVVAMCSTKPFLVGHSMGGAVVQQYIGKYDDTVQGAVLFAPATAPHMTRRETSAKRDRNLRCAVLVALLGVRGKKVIHNAAFFTGQDKAGNKIQRIENTSPFRSLLQAESIKVIGRDLNNLYSENYNVNIPVFVIGSYADLYFPQKSLEKTAGEYAQNGKTALVILERLCHDMMLDPEWKKSAESVLEFVEDPITFVDKKDNHWPRPKE